MPRIDEESKQCWIGIDPGAQGGIAVVFSGGVVALLDFGKRTWREVWDWMHFTALTFGTPDGVRAVIEKNTGYVGGAGNPGSAMFQFGKATGVPLGFLIAADVSHSEVPSNVWQKALGIAPRKKGRGAESKAAFKRRLKARAEQLFPRVKTTLATCDALLIAEYCRRQS